MCSDPSAFPCRGYGECVLWQWLLDGKKHCIDGSDEDPLYIRSLEFSFRCYYNRTRHVPMPPPLNYSDSFLKPRLPTLLPGFRPPQYPTLFPPLPTMPNFYLTPPPPPPSFTVQPPPVQLSRYTALPPLPPPFPTLLPSTSPVIPTTPVQLPSDPFSLMPTDHTTADSFTTVQDPFSDLNRPLPSTSSTMPSTNQQQTTELIIHGEGSQPWSPTTMTSRLPNIEPSPEASLGIMRGTKPAYGHIRGRGRATTTTTTPTTTTTTAKLTHIKVVTGETGSDDVQNPSTNQEERKDQGKGSSSITKVDVTSKESTADMVVLKQTTLTPVATSSKRPGSTGSSQPEKVNPKFQSRPPNGTNSQSESAQEPSVSSKTQSGDEASSNVIGPASKTTLNKSGSNLPSGTKSTTSTTSTPKMDATTQNICLAEMVRSAESRYPSRECECETGELLIHDQCEAREADISYYKLDVHSACGEQDLTSEQKKWVAIGKIGEIINKPWCVRITSTGDFVVNSICGDSCSLDTIREKFHEGTNGRNVTVEVCKVEGVRLKCSCRPGTNDTSNGLGKICEGVPTDDDCIMILGACLIFWLIILLGLLFLIPLLIFLLSHCCPGRMNSIHPTKEAFKLAGQKNGKSSHEENKHLTAMMKTLMEKTAGSQRELAMKMALAEIRSKKEKNSSGKIAKKPEISDIVEIDDAKESTPTAIVNNKPTAANSVQLKVPSNGIPGAVREIESIPGTVQPHAGETPILDKVAPEIALQSPSPEPKTLSGKNPLTPKSSQLSLTVPEPQKVPTLSPSMSTPAITIPSTIAQTTATATPNAATAPPSPYPATPPAIHFAPIPDTLTHPTPVAPDPSPPKVPTVVEVHRNSDGHEHEISRQPSTHSIGVQPTIWESYRALGDQYAKQDVLGRTPDTTQQSHVTSTSTVYSASSTGITPTEKINLQETIAPSRQQSPVATERSDRSVKLAEMLGVTLDSTIPRTPRLETRLTIPESDEAVVEEMSRQGIMLPISPHDIPTLTFDDRTLKRTKGVKSGSAAWSKKPSTLSGTRPTPPTLRIPSGSERVKESKTTRRDRTAKPPAVPPTIVFVPKKAREQQSGKYADRKAGTAGYRRATKLSSIDPKSRHLLKPPEPKMHSSTEESDPEVSAFQRLEEAEQAKYTATMARRRHRRPERQLSSISEKSAEIAAEAALQNQQRDYSISAPNTTRSLSDWHHYVKPIPAEDGSDTNTDIDLPSGSKSRPFPLRHRPPSDQTRQLQPYPLRRSPEKVQPDMSHARRGRPYQEYSSSDTSASAPTTIKTARSRPRLVQSPEIQGVTLERSTDRLDQLGKAAGYKPADGTLTSRSHIRPRFRARKLSDSSSRERLERPMTSKGDPSLHRVDWSQTSDTDSTTKRKISVESGTHSPSRAAHHHALISRKIATRRHEMHITKSTGDLTTEPSSSSFSLGRARPTSRSVENLEQHRTWASSPHRTQSTFHSDPFLPDIGTHHRKSRSVLNSPLGSTRRSSSKFSLASLPVRSASRMEFSPYFEPGVDDDKPPKEKLWW
ncbi:unnamed protein product [Nippostrongylus brasiliensis]|uniref:Uncharacterized protein n=1 Tax=Nippostrongylus brasiliensis TaxID=27835 RepID=A0A3P7CKY7_NIPBR|nr:unnamed protein product [Nippostrongylus brasiliensis]